MPRNLFATALAWLLLPGCIGSSYSPMDLDGDGLSPLEGDCWDAVEGPPGSGLEGANIHPSGFGVAGVEGLVGLELRFGERFGLLGGLGGLAA